MPRIRQAMRDVGAVSPDTACPESGLPEDVSPDRDRLLDAGIIRQNHSGAYYLHEGTASAVMWIVFLKAVSFWFLVIIIPVIILRLSSSPGSP